MIDPLPDSAWLAGQGGRREVHCRRVIVDAIFCVVENGIKWRVLPSDFPPWSTVYNYFPAWEAAGVTQRVLDSLRERVRLRDGRTADPSAAIIDSQSMKAAETVATTGRGRRRQEDQRPEASYRGGHGGLAVVRVSDRGVRAGP